MRIASFLLTLSLALSASLATAQQAPAPDGVPCPAETPDCTPTAHKGPADEVVNLPPAGEVQNVFFRIAPALGAVGAVALAAGGGGATTSTTSTVNN
ncbi:hypothetical protein SAMN04488527_10650 [Aliiroseovarius crassostreae]|uniref:Uncharacterized protein n=1 Tax=Aliiroseovarius crassostreae TaxID=154981 RepID=A0A0P7KI91_9RHOB|nr:hypothetical protein [Aliiroseovarius crassostreae]KPN61622.1 hypothetical protein AKJ29_03135 [Aliiroseovarius crassostreae]SFU56329.1 hypothetical protein SAMN04488527_10650 [Aliiroseovarius crassostreae]